MNSEVDKAISLACKILAYRQRTSHELAEKLIGHGFSEEIIRCVTEVMSRYGYIDDKVFTRLWIEQRLRKKGFLRLKYELLQKGVDACLIEEIITEVGHEAEFEAAFLLASKKLRQNAGNCSFQRLARFLQSRGYSYETIKKVSRAIMDKEAKP